MGTAQRTFATFDSMPLRFAQSKHFVLLTGDSDFGDVRNYPPARHFGIVVLVLPPAATSATIHGQVRRFLDREDVVSSLRGNLAIVEPGRIRLRR